MEARYKIFKQAQLIVVQVAGEANLADYLKLVALVSADSDFHNELRGVTDMRRVTSGLTGAEVRQFAQSVIDHKLYTKRWVVLSQEPLPTAKSLIYRNHIQPFQHLEVCCTIARASHLLGIELAGYLEF